MRPLQTALHASLKTAFASAPHLAEGFARGFAELPLAPALRFRSGVIWRALTWAQWATAAVSVRDAMSAQGVGAGDRVALVGPPSAQLRIVELATLWLGATCVLLDPRLPADERDALLRMAGCKGAWLDLQGATPVPAGLVGTSWALDRALAERAWRNPAGHVPAAPTGAVSDDAYWLPTQGTRQAPRLYALSHRQLLERARDVAESLRIEPGSEVAVSAPPAHAWTQCFLWGCVVAGVATTCAPSLELDDLEAVAPHLLIAAPDQLEKLRRSWENELWTGPLARLEFRTGSRPRLLDSAVKGTAVLRHRARLGGNLRAVVTAPGRLAVHTLKGWQRAETPVLESYGQAEAGGLVALNGPQQSRPGTHGAPLRSLQTRVSEDGILEIAAEHGSQQVGQSGSRTPRSSTWWSTGDRVALEGSFVRFDGRVDDSLGDPTTDRRLRALEDELLALPLVRRVAVARTSSGSTALLQADEHHARRLAAAEGWHPRDLVDLVAHPQILRLLRDGVVRAMAAHGTVLQTAAVAKQAWTVEGGELSVFGEPRLRVLIERFPRAFVLIPHLPAAVSPPSS